MATVNEIQVCGRSLHKMLSEACLDYLECIARGTDREKINFSIILSNGEVKHITIRQEDDRVVAYGDFEGLPNVLEWVEKDRMVKKCSNCYWGQGRKEEPKHFGCYVDEKWRKWIPKKDVDIPRECENWKEKS